MAKRDCTPNCDSKTYVIYKVVDKIRQDKIKRKCLQEVKQEKERSY